jgi:iron complex outermembrane receptor protein
MKNSLIKGLMVFLTMLYKFTIIRKMWSVLSDASGPLPGASILVKGTTNGAQTDFDGNFIKTLAQTQF